MSKIIFEIKKTFFAIIYNTGFVRFVKKYLSNNTQNKLRQVWYKLSKGMKVDFYHLCTISIETITACNLRCSYCPNSVYDRGLVKNMKKMEPELFYKIIDELAMIGWSGQIAPHFYGEPLLDDRLVDFVAYTRKVIPKSIISIFTNGELLNVALYKKLVNAGVSEFLITQHLPNHAKGVLEVLSYREKHGIDNVKLNYQKLEYVSNRGGILEFDKRTKIKSCMMPCNALNIDYDGNVVVCCHDYLNEIKVGNVNDRRLFDIWNDRYYQNIRKDISNGIFKWDVCKKCKVVRNK